MLRMRNLYILLPFICLLALLYLFSGDNMASAFSIVSHSRIANTLGHSRLAVALSRSHTAVSLKKNLETALTEWGVFHDQGYTNGTVDTIAMPESGQDVLKVSLQSGQPYAGIHAYRNLPAVDGATTFHMKLRFYFPEKQPIQALEFTMNKWVKDVRWEWALQWQAVPDGSSLQGRAESWRVWNGANWQDITVQQSLSANSWHTLDLYGKVVNGRVQYQSFQCDSKVVGMQRYTFAPVSSPGDRLAVGVQLDGNAIQQPYPVYFDSISLQSQ